MGNRKGNISKYGRGRLRRRMTGKRNPRWRGGVSYFPNHALLKRNRLEALKKSGGMCVKCGIRKAREVHRIDEDRSNHDVSNLQPMCIPCHRGLHRKRK